MSTPAFDPIAVHAKKAARFALDPIRMLKNEWLTSIRRHLSQYSTPSQRIRFLTSYHAEISTQIEDHRPGCEHKDNPQKCGKEELFALQTEFINGQLEVLGAPAPRPIQVQPPPSQSTHSFDPASIMRETVTQAAMCTSEPGKLSPKVAAAIVYRDQLATAYRGQHGDGDHAEYTLFEKVLNGADVAGATLYTTLEPCTSRNKHKPCADWIIEKRIARVIVGMLDPNPRIYGVGRKRLVDAGIRVEYYPVDLRRKLESLNRGFIDQYRAKPELQGEVAFNPLNNNGRYTIGHGDFLFELAFSQGGSSSVYIYNDPPSVRTVAVAQDHNDFNEILDATVFDTSSRARPLGENQIAVLQNDKGVFAAVKVLDVQDRSHGDTIDELRLSYRIIDNGTSSFS